MAFVQYGSLLSFGGPVLRKDIVANSEVITQMDSMYVDTDGFLIKGVANVAIYGHAINLVTNLDVGHNTTGVAGAAVGSFVNTFTHASDNETVAKNRAECDISQFSLYRATPASGTFGTTTAGSDQLDTYFDLSDEDDIDETSVSDAIKQYHSFGKLSTNHIVVNIMESSVFNVAA